MITHIVDVKRLHPTTGEPEELGSIVVSGDNPNHVEYDGEREMLEPLWREQRELHPEAKTEELITSLVRGNTSYCWAVPRP